MSALQSAKFADNIMANVPYKFYKCQTANKTTTNIKTVVANAFAALDDEPETDEFEITGDLVDAVEPKISASIQLATEAKHSAKVGYNYQELAYALSIGKLTDLGPNDVFIGANNLVAKPKEFPQKLVNLAPICPYGTNCEKFRKDVDYETGITEQKPESICYFLHATGEQIIVECQGTRIAIVQDCIHNLCDEYPRHPIQRPDGTKYFVMPLKRDSSYTTECWYQAKGFCSDMVCGRCSYDHSNTHAMFRAFVLAMIYNTTGRDIYSKHVKLTDLWSIVNRLIGLGLLPAIEK